MVFALPALLMVGQTAPAQAVFTDSILGFKYTPPKGLKDTTASNKEWIEQRAKALNTTQILNLLLALQADVKDTHPDWCSVAIETYPRQRFEGGERDPMLNMARWVAGSGTEDGDPTESLIGPFQFRVFPFRLQEGPLTKHARIYTIILKGQVVAVAFTANSTGVLTRIEASIKTFRPN